MLSILAIGLNPNEARAQTIFAESSTGSEVFGLGNHGQSFTAASTGTLGSWEMKINGSINGSDGTYYLYEGAGCGGTLLSTGNFINATGNGVGGDFVPVLGFGSDGVSVTSGQVYTIRFSHSAGNRFAATSSGNPYAGGDYYSQCQPSFSNAYSPAEWVFRASSTIVVSPNTAPTVTGVPSDLTFTEDTQGNVDLSAVTVADADGDNVTVTLTASAGTFAAPINDFNVTEGRSNGNTVVTLSGTAAAVTTYLDTASNLKYTPAANSSGNDVATITVKANDGTTDSTEHTANVDVTAVNDPPVLDDSQSPILTAIDEDAGDDDGSGADGDDDATANTNNPGTTVGTIVVDGSITDVDGAVEAIAVTGVDNTNGVWQYSTDGGTSWNNFSGTTGSSVDLSATARLLDGTNANHKIRFVPDMDYNGTATFTFRAWDKSTGTAGATADASSGGTGDSAFSTATDTTSITINSLPELATVTTTAPSGTGIFNSTLGGNVTADGGGAISERGVVWSVSDNTPTIGEANVFKNDNGAGTGVFSETIFGLQGASTTHYVRAYATNAAGTAYGAVQTLQTNDLDWTLLSQISGIVGPASVVAEGNTLWVGSVGGSTVGKIFKTTKTDRSTDNPIFQGNQIWDLFLDGNNLFVADNVGDDIIRVDKNSGAQLDIASNTMDNPVGVTTDGTHVYALDHQGGSGGYIRRFDKTNLGGPTSIVVSNINLGAAVEVDDTYIYWNEQTTIYRTPKATPGVKEQIWTGFNYAWGMHLHGDMLYVMDEGANKLFAANKDGTGILTEIRSGLTGARSVYVDGAGDIFMGLWSGGSVVKLTETAPTLAWTAASQSAYEHAGTATATASLSETVFTGGPTVTATVGVGGTATNTTDFSLNTTAISIPAGTASQDITVTIVDDSSDESDETVALSLTGVSVAQAGTPATHTLTIQDDDPQDWGDAPNGSYPTLAANNGARHIATGPHLGTNRDGESDGQQNSDASGDDGDGTDDDDGVAWDAFLQPNMQENIVVSASVAGKLDAWIDFNRDGDWADAGEQIFTSQDLTSGANNLSFTPPAGASLGVSFARFRVSTAGGLAVTGLASDGEVEDYQVTIGVNQTPTVSGVPSDLSFTEDTSGNVDLSAVTVADADGDALTVTLTASAGVFGTPTDGAAVGGGVTEVRVSDTVITLAGAAADINTYLDSATNITYTPALNVNGQDVATIKVKANDGTVDSAESTANVDVTAVNDDPTVVSVPSDVTVVEDTQTQVDLSALTFADLDAGTASVTLTVAVNAGTLAASSGGNVTVGGSGTATLTLTGTAANIDTYLNTASAIQYTSALNAFGDDAATLTLTGNDGGATGTGGGTAVALGTVTINITAVNDPPTITGIPADATVLEDAHPAANVDLSSITVGDPDGDQLTVTIVFDTETRISVGTTQSPGVTFTSSKTTLTATGSAAAINTWLDLPSAVQYELPVSNAHGDNLYSFTVKVGDGTIDTAPATVNLDVVSVNDAPSFTTLGNQFIHDDIGPQTIVGWASNFSAGPPDESGQALEPLSRRILDGADKFDVLPSVDAAGTLTYTPKLGASGIARFAFDLKDNGGTENGGRDTGTGILLFFLTSTNSAPVISIPDSPTVTEDQSVVINGISISDQDAGTSDLSVTLTASSTVTLKQTTGLTITAGADGTSSVTFTGTLANVNAALDGLTYAPTANQVSGASIKIDVSDNGNTGSGGALTDSKTLNIAVTAVNDDPTVVSVPSDVTVIEDVASNVDLSALTFGDVDSGSNDITLQVAVGVGVLTASDADGVSVTGSGTTTLTLTGTAGEIDSYLNTASAIRYTGAGDANGEDSATITLTANDQGHTGAGGGTSVQLATINIDITAVNDEPSFTKGADVTVGEDSGAYSAAFATNISAGPADESGQTLSFHVMNNTNVGLFATAPAVAANGTLTFTPADAQNGSANITIELRDDGGTANGGDDTSQSATFTINVTAVNDDPTVASAPTDVTVVEDTQSQVDLSALTFADLDSGGNDVVLTVAVNAGVLSAASAGGVTVGGDGTNTLTLTGTAANIDAYLNSAAAIQYTGAANANGDDAASVTLIANDQGHVGAGGGTDVQLATVNIDITPVNDQPSFTKGADVTVSEDAGAQTVSNWATNISAGPANEAAQALTFNVTNNSNVGLFAAQPAISADGTLTFTPNDGLSGFATITVELQDDAGTANGGVDTSVEARFVITVTGVNDPPTLTVPATATVAEDGSVAIAGITAGDDDSGSLTLSVTATSTATLGTTTGLTVSSGANGSSAFTMQGSPADVAAALATLTYAPSANQTTGASVTISLSDGELTVTKTIAITITAVNDPPIANNDTASMPSGSSISIDVLSNDSDVETSTLTVASVTTPTVGTATINASGTIDFTATLAAGGTSTFSYTVSDGDGGTATATVTVTIIGPSSDGDGVDDTVEANAPNGGDGNFDGMPDSQQTNVASLPISAGASQGQYLTVAAAPGLALEQTVNTTIPNPAAAPTGVTFPIGRVAFNVNNLSVGQTTSINIILPRGVVVDSYYKYGPTPDNPTDHWYEFTYDGVSGAVLYPETPAFPPYIVLFLRDGARGDADLTANGIIDDPGVPIFRNNMLPMAGADAVTMDEDASAVIDVLANDTDADADPLAVTFVFEPTNGTASIDDQGRVVYTPNADFHGTDTFDYLVSDGNGAPSSASIMVTVNPIEDAPVAIDDTAATDEEVAVVVPFFANDSDADGDALHLVAIDTPMNGEVVYNNDKTLTYTPATGFNGTDSFTYVISDGKAQATATVTITVTGTNDAPVGVADTIQIDEDSNFALNALLANDTDEDGDPLIIVGWTDPKNGFVMGDVVGTFFYQPASDFFGTDSFTYTVSDGQATSTSTVSITIIAVNDAPVFQSEAINGPLDAFFLSETPYEVTYMDATDVDDTQLNYTWELSTTEDFAATVMSVDVTGGTASVPAADLIAALEPEGLGFGQQLMVYQRMRATDDEAASGASAAQAVTFARALNVSNESELGIPTEFYLSDNYPNPFNPSTTIEFGLPQAAHVTITMYDINGRQVQLITDRQLAPGVHRERIDMGTLPSGVYLYRMTAGSKVFTKTLHLIK